MQTLVIPTIQEIKAALIPDIKQVFLEALEEVAYQTNANNSSCPDRLLTKKEAAQMLNCSESTVDNRRREGVLKSEKLANCRTVYFKLSTLQAYIDSS